MHILLQKLLSKRGIKDINELDSIPPVKGVASEKESYEKWNRILIGEEVTVAKISEFCKAQIDLIESQWKNMDNEPRKNERLIILHNTYSTILKAISAPEVERAQLEQYLLEQIK